jgi:hypothetical protein
MSRIRLECTPGTQASASAETKGWARQDSNLGPRDYESPALTAELQAHLSMKNSVSLAAPNPSIDGMLTLSACSCIFANHEKTKASSA